MKKQNEREMGKQILDTIAPMFKGKTVACINLALLHARSMLEEECLFRPLSSIKRRKT